MKPGSATSRLAVLALLSIGAPAQVVTQAPDVPVGPGREVPPVQVFLVAGQSNAEGADSSASEVDSFPPFVGAAVPQPDVLFWYETGPTNGTYKSGGWIPLQPELQRKLLGPEITFARRVKHQIRGPLAIIKSASGGTSLAVDWDPGNPLGQRMYERTVALVRAALADLTSRNIPWQIEGVLWQQGENDMLDNGYVYQYGWRLSALINRLRADLGVPDLRWFVGETSFKGIWGIDYRDNMQVLRSEQLTVIAADPLTYFVPTSPLAFKINAGAASPHYHFGTEGQLQLGEAYADAYLSTLGIDSTHVSLPFGCGPPAHPGDTVRVFVLAGQRSMEGERAYVAEITTHPGFASLADPQENVLFRYRLGGGAHTSTDWGPLCPAGHLENFGPELSFGAAVAKDLQDPIAIVKITDSAGFLEDWLPAAPKASRPLYGDAMAFIQDALADLSGAGMNPVLEAVIWLPGEHDAWWTPFRKKYAANLTTLVANMRADLQAPGLRWFVAELADDMIWGQANLDQLDAQIQSVAAADPLLWFVETDLVPTPQLSAMFETEGVLQLGRLMAGFYLAH